MQIQIPGYSIVSTLSQGASAIVCLAFDKQAHRDVVLKIIPQDDDQHRLNADQLEEECQRLRQLVHPNIVTIFDAGAHAEHYFLAMQYLPGSSLNHKRFELDLLARLRVLADIARALDFVSEQGGIHAGLSLDNILINANDGRAILVGFGLGPKEVQTSSGELIAAHFWSPEQLQGNPLDARSDLYSLGVLLFVLLTDELPFQCTSIGELAAPELRATLPQLPQHLQTFQPIIDRLLKNDPQQRYQKARECLADLGALPESAFLAAVEGFDRALVHNDESPFEIMAKVAAFNAWDTFTLAVENADDKTALEADGAGVEKSVMAVGNTSGLVTQAGRTFFTGWQRAIAIATALLVIVMGVYVVAINQKLASTQNLPALESNASLAPVPELLQVAEKKKPTIIVEPGLEEQAMTLRAGLENNFSLVTDLVVIYRAALRGEDAREHAFAEAGLEELQRLFSDRIRGYLDASDLESAQRERDLVQQLFEYEELLPVLIETLSAVEH